MSNSDRLCVFGQALRRGNDHFHLLLLLVFPTKDDQRRLLFSQIAVKDKEGLVFGIQKLEGWWLEPHPIIERLLFRVRSEIWRPVILFQQILERRM